jgi:hypothetical protein
MATKKIDIEDLLGVVLFPVMSAIAFGTITLTVAIGSGFDLAMVLASGSSWEVNLAGVIAILGVAYVYVTNVMQGRGKAKYERYEWAAIIVAVGLLPVYMVVPPVHDFINSTPIVGLVAVVIQSVGVVLLSYYG